MNALFPKGNLDSWSLSIAKYQAEAMSALTRTVDPVISAALLELTGSDEDFSRASGTVQFEYDDTKLPINLVAELIYSVPSFKLSNASDEAVQHDRAFILAYLKQIETIANTTQLNIDTKAGTVRVGVRIKVGYKL